VGGGLSEWHNDTPIVRMPVIMSNQRVKVNISTNLQIIRFSNCKPQVETDGEERERE
jgi:hypothetical protein